MNPVTESYIPAIIRATTNVEVQCVSLDQIACILEKMQMAFTRHDFVFVMPELFCGGSKQQTREWNRRIRWVLSDLAASGIAASVVNSLVLVGGETSYSVLRRLDIRMLRIVRELSQAVVEA